MRGGADVRSLRHSRASRDKSGEWKSVSDQDRLASGLETRYGWTNVGTFIENDVSGADLDREELDKLKRFVARNGADVLIVWKVNRQARELGNWTELRNHCMAHGLHFWLVGGKLYDITDPDDKASLARQAVDAEHNRDQLIQDVVRGIADSAGQGLPAGGICPFGYVRLRNPRTGRAVGHEPDGAPRTSSTGHEWNPAGIVGWMFDAVRAGESINSIVRQLNGWGIPNPRTLRAQERGYELRARKSFKTVVAGDAFGSTWSKTAVSHILRNPAYLGHRRHHDAVTREQCWDAIVSADDFYAVQTIISDPRRLSAHSPMPVHLCTGAVLCGAPDCGRGMRTGKCPQRKIRMYRCPVGHASVVADDLDQHVTSALLYTLSAVSPALIEVSNDEAVIAARAELHEVQVRLAKWRAQLDNEDADPEAVSVGIGRAKRAVAAAEQRLRTAGLPQALRPLVGEHAPAAWVTLNMPQRREALRLALDVRVRPIGRGQRASVSDRLMITPLIVL